MTITEQQAEQMAQECGMNWRFHSFRHEKMEVSFDQLKAFANLAAASVEAENVKLREALERIVNNAEEVVGTDDFMAFEVHPDDYHTATDALAHPTSTEHLDAIVAERVREALDNGPYGEEVNDILQSKLAAAESKLAECQRDAERINWLERERLRDGTIHFEKHGMEWTKLFTCTTQHMKQQPTIRDAIDAAMSAKGGAE